MGSFPVSSLRDAMATSALGRLRAAKYTFALCCKSTYEQSDLEDPQRLSAEKSP